MRSIYWKIILEIFTWTFVLFLAQTKHFQLFINQNYYFLIPLSGWVCHSHLAMYLRSQCVTSTCICIRFISSRLIPSKVKVSTYLWVGCLSKQFFQCSGLAVSLQTTLMFVSPYPWRPELAHSTHEISGTCNIISNLCFFCVCVKMPSPVLGFKNSNFLTWGGQYNLTPMLPPSPQGYMHSSAFSLYITL